ncbi:uncharacterized protein LDX57_002113 [Aspergillus melleus]|uniref:uncharacterized protein n=1 Tax=Aspergillus melleus TaxID=138277 RepID=UPI001E8CD46C|nr:uncharacterized protein LDX57_002113 [Aspergillus melleus]KAH8424362.1 hypothetical protein LDX57_002113 [Aspergillus melleus]
MTKTIQSLTPTAITTAHTLINPYIHKTPLLTNTTLNNLASTPQSAESLQGTEWAGQAPANPTIRFFFKCENYQRVGAFKARGAFHALLRLIESEGESVVRGRGVVTHSSGLWSFTFLSSVQLLCFFEDGWMDAFV